MRTVLCAYCARENPKRSKVPKKSKKISKKVAKIPNHPFGHPTQQPREDGAVEETDGRECAFCVWIRFRVVNGGWNDGWNDDGRGWMMGEVGRASERRRRGPRALSLVRFRYPGL